MHCCAEGLALQCLSFLTYFDCVTYLHYVIQEYLTCSMSTPHIWALPITSSALQRFECSDTILLDFYLRLPHIFVHLHKVCLRLYVHVRSARILSNIIAHSNLRLMRLMSLLVRLYVHFDDLNVTQLSQSCLEPMQGRQTSGVCAWAPPLMKVIQCFECGNAIIIIFGFLTATL